MALRAGAGVASQRLAKWMLGEKLLISTLNLSLILLVIVKQNSGVCNDEALIGEFLLHGVSFDDVKAGFATVFDDE